jgi:DNA-binding NarL/FixJ family response regulator
MKTNIFLIEDDVDFVKYMSHLLQNNPLLEVAGIATTLAEARAQVDMVENEIYLVDITLPDGSGIDMMQYIHGKYPFAKILALSTLGNEKHIFSSIQAGASGYLLKSEMPANIIQCIISLINDGAYLSAHASKILITKFFNISAGLSASRAPVVEVLKSDPLSVEKNAPSLTPKEHEILFTAQSGSPAKVIAVSLGISVFTVNQHLRSIYRKFNVRNKLEAIQSARSQGLI